MSVSKPFVFALVLQELGAERARELSTNPGIAIRVLGFGQARVAPGTASATTTTWQNQRANQPGRRRGHWPAAAKASRLSSSSSL